MIYLKSRGCFKSTDILTDVFIDAFHSYINRSALDMDVESGLLSYRDGCYNKWQK